MQVAYLECFSGISGDMLLGALVHAGVSPQLLQRTVAALNIGAELRISSLDRSGISATKVEVLVDGSAAESHNSSHAPDHHHHDHPHSHGHEQAHDHAHDHPHPQAHQQHEHDVHGRSLSTIREIIRNADLPQTARQTAVRAFELLGEAEAGIHNVPVQSIHFHEVGAVDAIVDIVCAAVACEALGVDEFVCSPLNVGGGTVKCAHGEFPIPAPATLALLKGVPIYSSGTVGELVTPTGAALIRALNCRFSSFPKMAVHRIGYGAGTRNPSGHPNVLRISTGHLIEVDRGEPSESSHQKVTVIETTIDDLSPQVLGYVTERAFHGGALDVFVIPVQMKKNRPGSLLTVLCDDPNAEALRELLFRETTTIGIRTRHERRDCLERKLLSVATRWGAVTVKESRLNGEVSNFAPEYEECRSIAEANSVPLKQVQQEAMAAYLAQHKGAALNPQGTTTQPGSKSQVA